MSADPGGWAESMTAARDLPDGEAKIAELERIAAFADAAGYVRLGVDARLELIETYRHHGQTWRLAEPLRRCLVAVDTSHGIVTAAEMQVLRAYQRHAVEALTGSPRIGLDQARSLLNDLTERLGADDPALIAQLRCRLADHVGDEPGAREWFARWRSAGPGGDCPACLAVRQAELLAGWGEWAEAARVLDGVLDDPGDCTAQPEQALAAALLPYLRLGRFDEAGRAHVRAYHRHRREWDGLRHLPAHLLFCALSGQVARGLDILVDQLPRLDRSPDERSAMEFAATGALLCRLADEAGPAWSHPVAVDGTVAALGARLSATATDLSGRFDARNGTGHQSARVAAWLTGRPLTTAEVSLSPLVPDQAQADGAAEDEDAHDCGPSPEEPAPLTTSMITAVLESRGDRCALDPTGTVVGRWGEALIRFALVGEARQILHARVVATHRLPQGQLAQAYEFCNAWNRDHLLPKAYVYEVDGGEVAFGGDVTTDLGDGVAPVQLAVLVETTVTTGVAYAQAVAGLCR